MIKKFVKTIFILGLLSLIGYMELKSNEPALQIDFESYLQPHDLAFLSRNEPIVFMTTDVLNVIANVLSNEQIVKDLVDHVKKGYCVVSKSEAADAIELILKSSDISSSDRTVLINYQQSIVNNDALVRDITLSYRRTKVGKFCTLFLQQCANVGHLNVGNCVDIFCNLSIGGSIQARKFRFGGTGCTGCTGGSRFNNMSSCGNIQFNKPGVNVLNVQGAFESFSKLIRGTIDINPSITGIILIPSGGPGTAIAVAALPSAVISSGSGLSVRPVSGAAFSSGMVASTPGVKNIYSIDVNLKIPVIFDIPYSGLPTIDLTIKSATSPITTFTFVVDDNTTTVAQVSVSAVTRSSATVNFVTHSTAQGATYNEAVANVQTIFNNFFSDKGAISIDMLAQGTVH